MLSRPLGDESLLSVLHAIGEGLVVVDAGGAPLRWNPAAERMLGSDLLGTSDWLKRPGVFFSDGSPMEPSARPLSRALRGEAVDDTEIVVGGSRGGALLNVTARPIRDESGTLVGAVAIFREITERRRIEVERLAYERRYRTLAQHLPATSVFLFDRQMRFILAEGQGLASLGIDPATLEGKTLEEAASPHLLPLYAAALAGESGVGETARQGRIHQMQFAPVFDEVGNVTMGLAVAQDVTDERRAAAILRQTEEQLRLALDHAPIGMAIVGMDGRSERVNQALCEILGYSPTELLEKTFRELTHPDDLQADISLAASLRRGEIPRYRLAKRYIRKDGRILDAMLHVSLVRDDAGEPRQYVVQVEDLTERKLLEARVHLNERMASVGTLAGGMAHEINNPLAAVTANLDLITEELAALGSTSPSTKLERLSGMADQAREGAERVRKIVFGLETFSRGDEERKTVIELRPLLELSLDMAFNQVKHRARIVRDYAPTPTVFGDQSRLAQVFINLLVNAAQSIPEGHADEHEIKITTSTDALGRAVIEIRDDGCGIAPQDVKRVFDPFFTTKDVGIGTGLGLAICHGVVTSLGGQIDVDSRLGRGSTFRVSLPPSPPPLATAIDGPSSFTDPPKRGRVLVVDDEPAILAAVSRTLGTHNVVVTASSGKEALALLDLDDRFDAMVCDLMMPQMTGMELNDLVSRRWPKLAKRTIFLTGGAFTKAARAFLDRVENRRMVKPFAAATLRSVVSAVVASGDGPSDYREPREP